MKGLAAIVGLLLLTLFGCSTEKSTEDGYFAAENSGNVRQKRYTTPNETAQSVLEGYRSQQLNILGFYENLRNLYLSGGFSKGNVLNSMILDENIIPPVVWEQLIRGLERTRWEIKNGELGLKRTAALVLLNSPEALLREPWAMMLAQVVQERISAKKDSAHALRDLAHALLAGNLTRTAYANGTDLRQFLADFVDENLKESRKTTEQVLELLNIVHHVVGPEDEFGNICGILESIPWQVGGILTEDSKILSLFTRDLSGFVVDADIGFKLANSIRTNFQRLGNFSLNSTEKKFIDEFTELELRVPWTIEVLGPNGTALKPTNITRKAKSGQEMRKLLGDFKLLNSTFQSTTFDALVNGIGSMEDVKSTVILMARLIDNLNGSVENAIAIVKSAKSALEIDPQWLTKLEAASDIVDRLSMSSKDTERSNGTVEEGSVGSNTPHRTLFDLFLNANFTSGGPIGSPLFPYSQLVDQEEMIKLFAALKVVPSERIHELFNFVKRNKTMDFKEQVERIQDGSLVSDMNKYFGTSISSASLDEAQNVRSVLRIIANISGPAPEPLSYLYSSLSIFRSAGPKNAAAFLAKLSNLTELARDGAWLDTWQALQDMSIVLFGPRANLETSLEPFKLEKFSSETSSYQEIFLALQMLMASDLRKVEAKLRFIEAFFGPLKSADVKTVLNGLGVDAPKIRAINEATNSVDDLVALLRASGSFDKLVRLLVFHQSFTTDFNSPTESVRLITDMIVYLQMNGFTSKIQGFKKRKFSGSHDDFMLDSYAGSMSKKSKSKQSS
ncbi:unnamed protein product [Caenorhabditis sp. 36 PRJEB53466]|nr:unnamed protein product [Caenorhabditis sp. 36 PRJEB53466]